MARRRIGARTASEVLGLRGAMIEVLTGKSENLKSALKVIRDGV